MNAADRIVRAKIQLRRKIPLLAHLVIWLEPLEVPDGYLAPLGGSIGVDVRGVLRYEPGFIQTLGDLALMQILGHEVLHPALNHYQRQGSRDRGLWNIAGDISINGILNEYNMDSELHGGIQVKHDAARISGMIITGVSTKSTEQIYEELRQQLQQKQPGDGEIGFSGEIKLTVGTNSGQGNGQDDSQGDGQDDSQGDGQDDSQGDDQGDAAGNGQQVKGSFSPGMSLEAIAREWKKRVQNAVVSAINEGRGLMPSSLRAYVDSMLDPVLPWYMIIEKFLERGLISDFSYRRPRRTFYDNGIYLPSVVRENVEIIYHCDTSGSMDNQQLQRGLSELGGLLAAHPQVRATVLMADSVIQAEYELTSMDRQELPSLIEMKGRGGTSHRPVVDWILENRPDANALVTFTDAESDIEHCFDDLPETCRTLLALTKRRFAGKTREAVHQQFAPYVDEIVDVEPEPA